MRSIIVTAPTIEPLTAAEARAFLRIDSSDEDSLLEAMIEAARNMAQAETGHQLLTCTRKILFDDFPVSDLIALPYPPAQSVTHVKYYDTSGTQQTMTVDTDYKVDITDEDTAYVYLPHGKTWPSTYDEPNVVEIQYVCGWASTALLPEGIRQWVRMAVATMYEHREQFLTGTILTAMPRNYLGGLLDPHRIVRVA